MKHHHQDIRDILVEADSIEVERLRMRQPHAWRQLQDRIEHGAAAPSFDGLLGWKWASMSAMGAVVAMFLVMAVFSFDSSSRIELMHVNKPSVYASEFYSPQANADVIWLSGLPMAQEPLSS